MECACTVGDGGYDNCVTLISITTPVANKSHKCNECGRTIPAKEEYIRESYVYDGHFSTHKTCEDCFSIRQVFFSNGWIYGDIKEQMAEFIVECSGDISVSCIKELTKPARDWALDKIQLCYDHMYEEYGDEQ